MSAKIKQLDKWYHKGRRTNGKNPGEKRATSEDSGGGEEQHVRQVEGKASRYNAKVWKRTEIGVDHADDHPPHLSKVTDGNHRRNAHTRAEKATNSV